MLKSFLLLSLLYSAQSFAHCPNHLKEEKLCLMLDKNMIYFYSDKSEHNGPYKDLLKSSISKITSEGVELKFQKVTRGIYKIEDDKIKTKIEMEILNDKKKITLKLAE